MSSDQGALPYGAAAPSPAPEAPGPDPSPDDSPTPLPPPTTPPPTLGLFNAGGFNYPLFNTTTDTVIAPTGEPAFPWTLFRGVVIGKKVESQGSLLRLTLDLEDYNRLASRIKVGAPEYGIFLHQDDPPPTGTDIAIDANAQTSGVTPSREFYKSMFDTYWAGRGVTFDSDTYLDDIMAEGIIADYSTALTDWKSFSDDVLRYFGPYARAWVDADFYLHLTRLAGVGDVSDFARPAPYALDDAGVLGIMPMRMEPSWDYTSYPNRVFIRGGTPPASFWINMAGPYQAGEEYHDAPGAVTAEDSTQIMAWAQQAIFKPKLTMSATVNPGHNGWRVGQTLLVTSDRMSQADLLPAEVLDQTPMVIQKVSGRLVGGGSGLTITINGTDMSHRVTWKSLDFAEAIEGAEKAKIVVEIVDPDEEFVVQGLTEVLITTDGDADIEYDLDFGDIEAGDLAKAIANHPIEPAEPVKPVYHFNVIIHDRRMEPPTSGTNTCLVRAYLADAAEKPVHLANVIVEWVLLDWADADMTIPGSDYSIDPPTGITDATGHVFATLSRGVPGTPPSVAYEVRALALPIP